MGNLKKIKFISDMDNEYEGALKIQYSTKTINTRYLRVYDRPVESFRIGRVANILLNFLVSTMNSKNIIFNNSSTREHFFKFINERFSINTVKSAYRELIDKDLIVSIAKGEYMVNPEYFFRGSQSDREVLLKRILEFRRGIIKFDKLVN